MSEKKLTFNPKTAMSILASLVMGIIINMVFGIWGTWVSIPLSTGLIVMIISRIWFSRLKDHVATLLTFMSMCVGVVILIASINLPIGAVPSVVKLLGVGWQSGWLAGLLLKAWATHSAHSIKRWNIDLSASQDEGEMSCYARSTRIQHGLPNTLHAYEHPRPLPFDDAFHFDPTTMHQYIALRHVALLRRHQSDVLRQMALFSPTDEQVFAIARDKERACPACHVAMSFAGFAITNRATMRLPQLAKIWLDERVVLHCCQCFKDHVEMQSCPTED